MLSNYIRLILIPILIFSQFPPLTPSLSAPAQPSGWDLIGQAGGPSQGLAVEGDYAYIGVGPRLVVVDISDPTNPQQAGASPALGDFVLGVAVSGNHTYVAAGSAGLQIFDITNPVAPALIGAWQSLGQVEGVTISGDIAYVANGPLGLRVLDVSDPAAPVEIARAFETNYAYDVTIYGRYAYIAAAGAGLLIADISNPAYPMELGIYDTTGYAHAVAVSRGMAYVADQWGGLKVVNVTDPRHPTLASALPTPGWAFDVTLDGGKAYIADAFKGLRLVNIVDPAHPAEMSGLAWPQSNAFNVAAAGNVVFLVDRKNGLRVVNTANSIEPLQVGFLKQVDIALMAVANGNYAYVAAGFKGVRILNISDPARPYEVGAYEFNSYAMKVKVVGSHLFTCTNTGLAEQGVHLVDISDPANPQKISYYSQVGECRGIGVAGNLGYFADAGGLQIIDFSDLANPVLIGSTQEWAGSVDLQGNLAYVAQGPPGWKIYDVSNPAHITVVSAVQDPSSFPVDIKVVGGLAYVAQADGLWIYNVSNPTSPVLLSKYISSGTYSTLDIASHRVYLSKGEFGFEVLDVSDALHPALISKIDTLGFLYTVVRNGEFIYTADGNGGFNIYMSSAASSVTPARVGENPTTAVPTDRSGLALMFQQRSPLGLSQAPAQHFPAPDRPAGNCVVTTTANSGPGSLRACLEYQVSGDTITFSPTVFPPGSPATIFVTEQLPGLDKGNVTLDGSNAGVILDGSGIVSSWACGVLVTSNGNTVRGLQIRNFLSVGIFITGSDNLIGGSRLVGSGPTGQGNVTSANRQAGIALTSKPTDAYSNQRNRVLGNIVGLDVKGEQAVGGQQRGIGIWVAQDNIIGSLTPGENNIVSGQSEMGMELYGDLVSGNKIIGNYVGTDISGTKTIGNANGGIVVWFGSNNTLVQENLVSGSGGNGSINFWDWGSDFNTAIGNKVGTDLTGTQPLPNFSPGITVGQSAYTRVGGTEPGEGNLVYGDVGIRIEGSMSAPDYILGNQVGLNLPASAPAEYGFGIGLYGAQRSMVGGATLAEGNTIFQDQNTGILANSDHQTIIGNRIGVTADGSTPLRRSNMNLWIAGSRNMIQANQAAFASGNGVWIPGQTNTLRRNLIYGSGAMGILLVDGGNANLPAPSFSLDSSGGSGTTCPGCTVELFLDDGNQARAYLDSVAADDSGHFSFPARCPVPYPYMNATVTDLNGNTSEFNAPHVSQPRLVPWDCSSSNPTPALVSVNPTSVKEFGPTTLLNISGAGFIPGSIVRVDAEALTTLYTDASHIAAILPVGQITTTGTVSITVFNAAPGGGASNALPLEILPHLVTDPTDLSVSIVGEPNPVLAGAGVLTYTLNVSNLGPSLATSVMLTDTLPLGVTILALVPSQGSCAGSTQVTCNLGEVNPYLNATVQISVAVDPSTRGALNNLAGLSALEPDPDKNNNTAEQTTTVYALADLALSVSSWPDPVIANNQQLIYTLTVTNNGPSQATGVILIDSLPVSVTLVWIITSQGVCSGMTIVTCNLGNLEPSSQAMISIAVMPRHAGLLINQAKVNADEADSQPNNNLGLSAVNVRAAVYLPLVKKP